LPNLLRWRDQLRARPAVAKGIEMPRSSLDLRTDDDEKAKQFAVEARKMLETGQSQKGGV
jgi:glutathione S-transferase/GST-like protein